MAQATPTANYDELRTHELRKNRWLLVDGNLVANEQSASSGASARVYEGGYWGFASASETGTDRAAGLRDLAARNARAMGRFGAREPLALPTGRHRGEHEFRGAAPLSAADCIDRLRQIHEWCRARYPDVKSTQVLASDEHHRKHVRNSVGTEALNSIQRALVNVTLVADDDRGAPVEVLERLSWKGHLGDRDWSLEAIAPQLDEIHGHLQAKRHAVPAKGGIHSVVMAPQLAGILAHEAMGHPCEADLVLAGASTSDLVGRPVASELITMVDYAHHVGDREVDIPVYCDDEGTPARDAVLIRDGILTEFMSSVATAARLGIEATGNARAYAPDDEPLVRMRNTAILPGKSKLADMVAGLEDGYLLLHTGNGQADSTTEFMFAIRLAYEVKDGKLGRAIRDTTISGSAMKVLQAVDAVSDDMVWNSGGYCGKKQVMVVSMGGPAIRTRVHVGGE